jgi:hypothetical protein
MRPQNPQGALMKLMRGHGTARTVGDQKLKAAHHGPISGRG